MNSRLCSSTRPLTTRRDFLTRSAFGLGGLGLVSKFHRHFGAWSIPAPERVGLLLLQHHVVANDGGEFEFSAGSTRQRSEEGGK